MRFAGLSLLAAATLSGPGCSIEPSGSDLPAPRAEDIYLFYPTGIEVSNGQVRGRGLPGAAPAFASHIVIESHPGGLRAVSRVEPEGFVFQISALSGDVLEFRGADSEDGDTVGAPVFIRVPASIEPYVPHVCCKETGVCQTIYEREAGAECEASSIGVVQCVEDVDCAAFEGQLLPLSVDDIAISPPNAQGRISIEGNVLPNVLVTVANVGLSSIKGDLDPDDARRLELHDPGIRLTTISDGEGRFFFGDVPAAGDDEIIVQYYDLRGYRSPPYASRVPDAPLAGVDVLGVFPWTPLSEGEVGQLVLRVVPFGIDGRGICPDRGSANDGLELCFGGGLEHEMVELLSVNIDGRPVPATRTATSPDLPHNRGVVGNIRARPLDVMLVLDRSAYAAGADQELTFAGLRSYVENLRSRDAIGLVLAGTPPRIVSSPQLDRSGLIDTLNDLETTDDHKGESTVLDAVRLAGEVLRQAGNGHEARIVLVTFGPPEGPPEDARDQLDAVLDVVEAPPGSRRDLIRVDAVSTLSTVTGDPSEIADRYAVLQDLPVFARGVWRDQVGYEDLGATLAEVQGEQLGSFLLMYDVLIPDGTGKVGELGGTIRVTLPGAEPRTTELSGPFRVAYVPNP